MKTEFVRFFTEDDIELQGLYFAPSNTQAHAGIIHVHGLAGNFYENRFIDYLAKTVVEKGYAFLAFNNRGHDYLSDLLKKSGSDWSYILGGGAHEIFDECLYDIDAALNLMQNRGVTEVCLQGHSTGANKVVFYESQRNIECLRGEILLSPCDDVGLQKNSLGEDYDEVLDKASTMAQEGNGEKLMPEGSFFDYPISAKTYLDYFKPESKRDIFPYRNPQAKFEELSAIECPILALFGNVNEYVLGDLNETLSLLEQKATASSRVETDVIEGAPHNYLGREEKLSKVIANWLDQIKPVE
jgi:alpha/beta superfamily hydrolase